MEQTISITGLTQYGTAGWAWTETTDFRCLECRTNGAGAGLWVRRPGLDREFQQQRGTAQFRLPASRAAAYAKIRRDAIAGL